MNSIVNQAVIYIFQNPLLKILKDEKVLKFVYTCFKIHKFLDNLLQMSTRVENDYKLTMILHIRNITHVHFRGYRCIVRNSLGETDGLIRLYGAYPFPTFLHFHQQSTQPTAYFNLIQSIQSYYLKHNRIILYNKQSIT